MSKILEVVDVHSYYGETHILYGVSLDLEEGGIVALLGRNGMGKTTLVRSVWGGVTPKQAEADPRQPAQQRHQVHPQGRHGDV